MLIQNVVSTFQLHSTLDLSSLARCSINIEYNPRRFSACIIRQKNPRTTCLLFNNGYGVCSGAKSVSLSKKAARRFARRIQQCGYNVRFDDFQIRNIVASHSTDMALDLCTLPGTYTPELFPGLTYRYGRMSINLFTSGKFVITGASSETELDNAFHHIMSIIK